MTVALANDIWTCGEFLIYSKRVRGPVQIKGWVHQSRRWAAAKLINDRYSATHLQSGARMDFSFPTLELVNVAIIHFEEIYHDDLDAMEFGWDGQLSREKAGDLFLMYRGMSGKVDRQPYVLS